VQSGKLSLPTLTLERVMTDKELLELAAKAAGLWEDTFMLDGDWNPIYDEQKGFYLGWGKGIWNPLTDDGDALRLAVKLNIPIWECAQYNRAMAEVRYGAASGEYWEPVGDDPYAATRRAIVRAAAEIGKSL